MSSVGFDAFTHSLEAYTSKKSNPLTDAQALLGIMLITENLPKLMSNYDDDDAWEKVSLAEAEGISLTSMRDSFSKIYGMPPIRYLTMLRLNASKKLLAETDQSIETIAQKCGFTDQFYFSRVFKRQCGVTPSEFRKIILMDI